MGACTPGPWSLLDIPGNATMVVGPQQQRVVNMGYVSATTQADARLIAAAPTLLAALRELVSASNSVNETIDDRDENDKAINRLIDATFAAVAAISKATAP